MQECMNDGTKGEIVKLFEESEMGKGIQKLKDSLKSDQVHHILIGKKGKLQELPKRWRKENFK